MALRLRAAVIVFLCFLVFGGIPGTLERWRGGPLPPVAPPVPESVKDRDGAVEVTVVGPDRAPLAGATVAVFALPSGRAYLAGRATTAEGGKARLERLPRGEAWVLAEAPGMARGSARLILGPEARAVELSLDREHRLAVTVRDEAGAPVTGAEVELVPVTGGELLPVGARTGEDGRVDAGRLRPGPWTLTVRAQGFEEQTHASVREGDNPIVTLRKMGALIVKVQDGDRPAPGARVLIAGATLWPPRAADTDESGAVRISALASGSYALRATLGTRVSPIELGVMLGRGEEKTVILRLVPGRMVGVRVVEGEGDDVSAVDGARVTLAESGLSPFPLEAVTGKDGRARLGPIAPGSAQITARADDFVPRGTVSVPDKPEGDVVVTLVRAGIVVGRVVDARGFPIDGATLEIIGTDFQGNPIADEPRRAHFREAHFQAMLPGPSLLTSAGELGVMAGPVPPIPHLGPSPAVTSAPPSGPVMPVAAPPPPRAIRGGGDPWVTRGDGTYRAAPVTPGRVRALVRHPQYVEAISEVVTLKAGAEATVDVVMHTGGSLEGRVVDHTGRAAAGARVILAATRGSLERTTRAASDGTFAFASVPPQVIVSASAAADPHGDDDGGAVVKVEIQIPEGGRRELTLTLPEPREPLPVRVNDDRGVPIEGAQVTAHSLEAEIPLRVTSFTDARGETKLRGARGVRLRVELSAGGRAPKAVTVEPTAAALTVALVEAESAGGEVRTTRGDAIEGAEVVLYTEVGARHARTDGEGAFAIREIPPGPAKLKVRAPGFAPMSRELDVPAGGRGRAFAIPRVELPVEGIVEGTVVDERGDPVQGARISQDTVPTFLVTGTTPPGIAVADARGRFKLGELPEGSLTLEAFAPDVGRGRALDVKVTAGRTTVDVRITLKKEGKGTDPDSSGGVAVTLGERTAAGEVVVVAVAEGSAAERAGVSPGDVIVQIDGVAVRTIEEARARLSGPIAEDVVLKLRREGQVRAVRVAREPVRR